MFKKKLHRDNELSKDEAIQAMINGSAEAFHLLYNEYSAAIYRFCLRMVTEVEAAQDAFQETFIKVYENRATFKGDNFSAWLYTIARNTCLNYLRSKRQFDSFDESFHGSAETSKTDIGLKEQIQNAIATLPVTYREAILLREYEDCTYQEIAQILDIDISLAKIRVFRARNLLRKLLQPLVKEINET